MIQCSLAFLSRQGQANHVAAIAKWRRGLACVLLCAMVTMTFVAAGCGSSSSPPARPANAKPIVVASIFPIASVIEQIMGDTAEVRTFMPAGANPHSFEPGATQVAQVARADMIVPVGLNFDNWLQIGRAHV